MNQDTNTILCISFYSLKILQFVEKNKKTNLRAIRVILPRDCSVIWHLILMRNH